MWLSERLHNALGPKIKFLKRDPHDDIIRHHLFLLASVSLVSAEESHIEDLSLEVWTALSGLCLLR